MPNSSTYQPVILIGAARSGTKLLRDVIARHPGVDKVPYDVNYIWRIGNEKTSHDALQPSNLSESNRQRISRKITAFSTGKPILIEKTVSNCLRIPYVLSIFPNARLVYLQRDGYDVVEAVYRQWQEKPDLKYIFEKMRTFPIVDAFGYAASYAWTTLKRLVLQEKHRAGTWGPRYSGIDEDVLTKPLIEVCAIQWQRCIRQSTQDLQGLPDKQVFRVVYEDFVRNPGVVLSQIAEFLGIQPELFPPDAGIEKVNQGRAVKHKKTFAFAAKVVKTLQGTAFDKLIDRSVNFAKKAGALKLFGNSKDVPVLDNQMRYELSNKFVYEIVQLEAMIGIDLGIWKV